MSRPPEDLVVVAKTGRPHGIKGEIRLYSLSDVPGRLEGLRRVWWLGGRGARVLLRVQSVRPAAGCHLAKFEGYDTPEDASSLTQGRLAIPAGERGALPPGRYFIDDILGARAVDETGRTIGVVRDVIQTGANDIFSLDVAGREVLVPVIPGVILDVDVHRRVVTVRLPEGMDA